MCIFQKYYKIVPFDKILHMMQWKGVMPAVTTKFNDDLSLDFKLIEKNTEAQIDAGVHGIILAGSLGEVSTLEQDEKNELLVFVKEVSDGRCPVVMNIAESSTKNAVKAAQLAEKHGADGLMVLPPMRYKSTDHETMVYFETIANSTSLPIMIYNNPVDYKIEVTIEMFERLLKLQNVKAVKESTRDVSNVTRLRNAFGDDLSILCGVDTLALESLLLGADGWVAGLVCAFPKETVAIYNAALNGDLKTSRELYRWFMPLLELDIDPQLVQNIKLAEVATGLGSEIVRPPRLNLIGTRRKEVLQIIEKQLQIRPKL